MGNINGTQLFKGNDLVATAPGEQSATSERSTGHDNLPSFIVALRIRAAAVNWNAPAPYGILLYNTHNLLTDHHSITMATLEAARIARVDPQACQNSIAFYECLKQSIATDMLATHFEQAEKVPGDIALQDGS